MYNTVNLALSFIDEKKKPVESNKTEYNKPTALYESTDLYSGWLDTEVVQNICLNKNNNTVTIPDLPEGLKSCINTNGNQILSENVEVGDNVKVGITVRNPRGKPETIQVQPIVRQIQACTVCKINKSVETLAEAHNTSHLNVSWGNLFKGCKSFEVKDLKIVVDNQTTTGKFAAKSALIPTSPCSNHSIHVELSFRNIKKVPLKSKTVIYPGKGKDYCIGEEKESRTGPEASGPGLGLMIGLPAAVRLTLCCVAVLLLVWRKKLKAKEEEQFDEEDENPVYGIYAGDDEADDTAEVTKSNDQRNLRR